MESSTWSSARRQVIYIGLLAFCGPGMFNALNGLGNAGSDDATVAALSNSCLFFTFTVSGFLAPVAFNVLGPLSLFVLGGLTYAVYAACIFWSTSVSFLPIVGGIVLGVGAGIFWTAQSSLMTLYGTPYSRGTLIAIFWIIFNAGGVAGGLMQFGMNYHNEGGSANAASYFAFIVVMILGALAAPCLLAKPSTVMREDGTKVEFETSDSPLEELWAALSVINDPFVWYNALFWLASNWFYTYDFSGFNGHQFNVRTRGLNSALFWAGQMVAAWMFAFVLDSRSAPMTRARRGLLLVLFLLIVSLGGALYGNFTGSCTGQGWDKDRPCSLDFKDDFQSAWLPMFINILLGASDAIYQNYALWLMSTVAQGSARKTVAYAGAYKGIQSLGAGCAWMLDLFGVSYKTQGLITLVLAAGGCAPLLKALPMLRAIDEVDSKNTEQ